MMERLSLGSRGSDVGSTMESDLGSSWGSEKKSLSLSRAQLKEQLLPATSSGRLRATEPVLPRSSSDKDRDRDRDKDRDNKKARMQRQILLEHEERNLADAAMHKDLQRRVDEARDRIARVEAQLEEVVARTETRLRARDEDLAELREELRTARPTMPAWGPEAGAGAAAAGGSAPEEAGPGLGALAADLAELRRSVASEMSEHFRRHEEASAAAAGRMAALERQLQEGLDRLREADGEHLSEGVILQRRLSRVEAALGDALDRAAGRVEAALAEDRTTEASTPQLNTEASPDADRGPSFASPGSASSWRSRLQGNLLEPLEAVEEVQEVDGDRSAESPVAALRDPRLSIMKGGGDFDPSPGSRSSTQSPLRHSLTADVAEGSRQQHPADQPDKPRVRRSSTDLAEVMRLRRESCEEWVSPSRPSMKAAATSPALGESADYLSPDVGRHAEDLPSVDCSPAAASSLATGHGAESVDCGEELAEAKSLFAGQIRAVEARLDAGDQRLEDLQSGISLEITALRDLVEALPMSGDQGEAELHHHLAAESAALDARLKALESRAELGHGGEQETQRSQIVELRDRVEALAGEVGQLPAAAAEASALGERVRALEARLQDSLSEFREGQEAELAALRSRVEAVEGEQSARPPEQCPEATSPDRARAVGSAAPSAEANNLDGDIEELGRRLEGSDSRIEELMKRMMAESQEERSESTEQQAAAIEASSDKAASKSVAPQPPHPAAPTPPALQLPVAGSRADDPLAQGSETRRALEDLRGRLQAEAEGLRERMEVHAERCDERIRRVHEERAEGEARLLERLERAAAAGGRGEEAAEAAMRQHREEVTRSTEQCAALEGEQRRLASEASALRQRLEALESAEKQALPSARSPPSSPSLLSVFKSRKASSPTHSEAPALPEVDALRERVEALFSEQGQQLARTEEHQEAIEGLQGQVGVLETCLEENDGKLGEIQTTLMEARLEGIVAMDERLKGLERHLRANDKRLDEAQVGELSARSTELNERLAALERCFEDVRKQVVSIKEAEALVREAAPAPSTTATADQEDRAREFTFALGAPEQELGQAARSAGEDAGPSPPVAAAADSSPRESHVKGLPEEEAARAEDEDAGPCPPAAACADASPGDAHANAPPEGEAPCLAGIDAAPVAAACVESSPGQCHAEEPAQVEAVVGSLQNLCDEHVTELRRYVDERLRKLQSTQQENLADTAELRRRVDEALHTGLPPGLQVLQEGPVEEKPEAAAGEASPAEPSPDATVDERLQALEDKCSTMLNLLLRL